MSNQIITYVGKKSTCVGKTLWEIVGCLKGFGVGRIIQRGMYVDAYPEQTYYKIVEVKAEPNEVPPKIQVFRWPNDHRDKDVSLLRSIQLQYYVKRLIKMIRFVLRYNAKQELYANSFSVVLNILNIWNFLIIRDYQIID